MERREYPRLGETVWHEVLPNGLPVYVLTRPESSEQFACFAVRCGGASTRIPDGRGGWEDLPAGTAHYLEHKMFDTEGGSASDRFGETGASDNAFTSETMTAYYFTGTRDFEENLRTLLKMVSIPWFTRESVDKERGIIAQEIRMNEDDPYDESYCRLMELMYAADPVKTRVVGSVESIQDITPELLYRFHRVFYRPENMVLAAGGALDPARVCAVAREVLGDQPSGPAWEPPMVSEPAECVRTGGEAEMEVSMPTFQLGIKGDGAPAGSRLRQELLARLACDALAGPSAPLYSRLYGAGLINGDFSCNYDEATDTSARLVFSGESRDPARVREELLNEAARLSREGIDPALWERLTRAAYGGRLHELDYLRDTCIDIAAAHFDGEDYLTFPALCASLRREEAEALLGRWCVPERTALFVALPAEK